MPQLWDPDVALARRASDEVSTDVLAFLISGITVINL